MRFKSDPVWIRTKDLLLRRQLLYPAELRNLNQNKKSIYNWCKTLPHKLTFVGVAGFEPTTSWSQTKRDTGLRYTPKNTAEREGFEPSVPFPVRMFSKHVLSASQASLLAFKRAQM